MTILVMLPWPSQAMSPNSRDRWAKIAAVKAARYEAKIETLAQCPRAKLPVNAPLTVTLVFCRPSSRKYDIDGLISRSKAAIDGVADALNFNDSQIQQLTGAWGEPFAPAGRVELRLEVAA